MTTRRNVTIGGPGLGDGRPPPHEVVVDFCPEVTGIVVDACASCTTCRGVFRVEERFLPPRVVEEHAEERVAEAGEPVESAARSFTLNVMWCGPSRDGEEADEKVVTFGLPRFEEFESHPVATMRTCMGRNPICRPPNC